MSGIIFRSWKMGLEPILDFSGPDSGPGSCVVWNILCNLIQPIFPVPVPVPCSGPEVSQCEYTIRSANVIYEMLGMSEEIELLRVCIP